MTTKCSPSLIIILNLIFKILRNREVFGKQTGFESIPFWEHNHIDVRFNLNIAHELHYTYLM